MTGNAGKALLVRASLAGRVGGRCGTVDALGCCRRRRLGRRTTGCSPLAASEAVRDDVAMATGSSSPAGRAEAGQRERVSSAGRSASRVDHLTLPPRPLIDRAQIQIDERASASALPLWLGKLGSNLERHMQCVALQCEQLSDQRGKALALARSSICI